MSKNKALLPKIGAVFTSATQNILWIYSGPVSFALEDIGFPLITSFKFNVGKFMTLYLLSFFKSQTVFKKKEILC